MSRALFQRNLRRLKSDTDGAALVEFGMLLPVMLLFFAMAIEGSRFFWSYQSAIAGVRDASRFVGRSVPSDICQTGGNLNGYTVVIWDIVRKTSSGNAMFPNSISINYVTTDLECVTGTYRLDQTPIATVSVEMEITFPFQGVFGLFGVNMEPITTSVTDSTRIFGA